MPTGDLFLCRDCIALYGAYVSGVLDARDQDSDDASSLRLITSELERLRSSCLEQHQH